MDELCNRPSQGPRFVVEDILPVGLLLFAASPKTGKTRLLLQIGAAISRGEDALGRYPVRQGTVLYYALEDGGARFADHARSLGLQDCPDFVVFDSIPSTGRNRYGWLRDDLKQYADVRLVIIDVLNRVMPKVDSGKGAYHDEAEALIPLQELANEVGIAVVVVHHTRKSSDNADPLLAINGTQALPGTADNVWLLDREQRKSTGKLIVTGRDAKDQQIELRFNGDGGTWSVGNGETRFVAKLGSSSKERVGQAVEALVGTEPISRRALIGEVTARVVGMGRKYLEKLVSQHLAAATKRGTIREERVGTTKYYRRCDPQTLRG